MDCAAKGMPSAGLCAGPPVTSCEHCNAVRYCSSAHQKIHWDEHKEACERLKEQVKCTKLLHDLPFSFVKDKTEQEAKSQCMLLERQGIHQKSIWILECQCDQFLCINDIRINGSWCLPSSMCPCLDPKNTLTTVLKSWNDYYSWRCLPSDSPVALLLHWPLTIYHSLQLFATRLCKAVLKSEKKTLRIHYLGPEKELVELPAFGELVALFPNLEIFVDFIGPMVPYARDGSFIEIPGYLKCLDMDCHCKVPECEDISSSFESKRKSFVVVHFWKGFYHDRFQEITAVALPDLIIAPNAGIAAYPSWKKTIKLIREAQLPAMFSDYCEEAAILATRCINAMCSSNTIIPVQINPFRHPLPIEDAVLNVPTCSNSFLFGICF